MVVLITLGSSGARVPHARRAINIWPLTRPDEIADLNWCRLAINTKYKAPSTKYKVQSTKHKVQSTTALLRSIDPQVPAPPRGQARLD
jgi:hypothetical protein